MPQAQKEKLLYLLKDIMLSDTIGSEDKRKILDLILEYKGETEKVLDLLEKFLQAKSYIALKEENKVAGLE